MMTLTTMMLCCLTWQRFERRYGLLRPHPGGVEISPNFQCPGAGVRRPSICWRIQAERKTQQIILPAGTKNGEGDCGLGASLFIRPRRGGGLSSAKWTVVPCGECSRSFAIASASPLIFFPPSGIGCGFAFSIFYEDHLGFAIFEERCLFGKSGWGDPTVSLPSSPVDWGPRGPKSWWKQWLQTLRRARVAWAGQFVGRRRHCCNRLWKNRLERGQRRALVRLSCCEVLLLAPRSSRRRKRSHLHATSTLSQQIKNGMDHPDGSLANSQRFAPGFLRGGANKNERLLDGLRELLAKCDSLTDTNDETDSEGDDLFAALQTLVQNRPNNLLQELRSLVSRFSRRDVGKGGKSSKGSFVANQPPLVPLKGEGKSKGNGKEAPVPSVPGKGKGKARTKTLPLPFSQPKLRTLSLLKLTHGLKLPAKAKRPKNLRPRCKSRAGHVVPIGRLLSSPRLKNWPLRPKLVMIRLLPCPTMPKMLRSCGPCWLRKKTLMLCLCSSTRHKKDLPRRQKNSSGSGPNFFHCRCISAMASGLRSGMCYVVALELLRQKSLVSKSPCPTRPKLTQLWCEQRPVKVLSTHGMSSRRMLASTFGLRLWIAKACKMRISATLGDGKW